MKKQLLNIVQDVLDYIEADEVNSIYDTVESEQVTSLCEQVFYQLVAKRHIPIRNSLVKVTSLSDTDKPTYLKLPEKVDKLETLWYNRAKQGETKAAYEPIDYIEPEDFISRSYSIDSTGADVQEVTDFSNARFFVETDKAPSYYTSFDDQHIVFNSFDSRVDSVIQESKTTAYAQLTPEFQRLDEFVPELPTDMFPYYIAEVADLAYTVLKQTSNGKVTRIAREQKAAIRKDVSSFSEANVNKMPNYGRKR